MPVSTNRKKNRRARVLRRRLIVGCAALLLLGAIIFAIAALVRSCRTSGSKRSLPFTASSAYCYTGDGFLLTGERTLDFYSIADESKNFSTDTGVSGAHAAGTDRIKVLYDASSVQIVGTPYEHTFEGVIRKVVCGGKYVGVYVENADNTHSLSVFNSAGDRCYKADIGSTVLLAFGFEGGASSAMYTCELAVSGSAVSTTLSTYDLARESITGVMNIRGEVVKNVFITGKSVFVFATDSFIRFERASNTEAYRMLVRGYDCEDFCAADGKAYLLVRKSADEGEPPRVIEVREGEANETVLNLAADADASRIFVMGGKVVALKGDRLIVRDISGEVKAELSLGTPPDDAVKLDDGNILLIKDGQTMLYSLKNL